MEPLRILIADDHEAVRKGVRSLLSTRPDWQICGEAVDGLDAVEKAKSLLPDLVLMDVSMPRMDGIEAARIIRRDLPKVQVIIVSQNEPALVRRQAAEVDARGHVPKSDLAEQLIPTIERVMAEREKPPAKTTRSSEEEFRILERVGATLVSGLDLEKIVQAATDAGRELSEAEFGAFFYNVIDNSGEKYTLYTISGVPREAFSKFPMPRKTEVFGPTFDGTGTLRLDDVTKDSRYGKNAPYHGKPPGHLPVCSYLAVSVVSRSGEVLGGLFYGHSKPGIFTERAERLVEGIARQAAIAIDNARLLEAAERAKAQAQANAEQLRMALNASRTVAWSWDLKTGEITHSDNSLEVLGMPTNFHVSNGWKNVFAEDLPTAESIVNRAIAECSEYQLDFRMVHGRTGKVLWLHNRGKVECDASCTAVRLTGTTTDITERKLAEQTTGLMAAIVDSSDDAVISKNLNGIITSWNKSAELLFGHTPEEAIGKHITLIIPPERHQEETSIIERLKRGERIEHFETVRMRKDGSLLDLSLTISPVRDSEGRIIGASKIARDITERKQSEKALSEQARQQKALYILADQLQRAQTLDEIYAASLDAVFSALQCNRAAILQFDDSGTVKFVSSRGLSQKYLKATEGHSPWTRTEKNAQPIRMNDVDRADLSDSLRSAVKNEGIEALAFIPLISSNTLIGKFMVYFNTPHIFTDAEMEFSLTVSRQLAFGIARKRSETILDEHRERLDFINQASEIGFWFCDLPFDKLVWDDRVKEHFFLPRDAEVTIDMFYEHLHPEDREKTRKAIEDSIQCKTRYDLEYRSIGPTKEVKWIRAIGRAFYDSAGQPRRFDGVTLDVTQNKRAQEALRSSEERLRNLAEKLDAEVRARTRELELRNNDVLKQAEMLGELSRRMLRLQDDERRHIARELHDSAGQTLAVLGMNLAHISQLAASGSPKIQTVAQGTQELVDQLTQEIRTTSYLLHPPLLDENGLADALGLYLRGLAERSGLDIQFDIPENFGRLHRDLELVIFRLVQECLTNIHRHSESKTATVHIERAPGTVSLFISDEGQGIEPVRLAEIQSESSSGVGIRGMRERVRQFGGDMKIESNGVGTKVSVTIPVHEPATKKLESFADSRL